MMKSYINNSTNSNTFEQIKEKLELTKLGDLYLSKKDVVLLSNTSFDIEDSKN